MKWISNLVIIFSLLLFYNTRYCLFFQTEDTLHLELFETRCKDVTNCDIHCFLFSEYKVFDESGSLVGTFHYRSKVVKRDIVSHFNCFLMYYSNENSYDRLLVSEIQCLVPQIS